MMAPETLNTMHIDAADALVELSGAVLFQVWVCIYAYYTHVHRYIYTVYICTRVCVYTFIHTCRVTHVGLHKDDKTGAAGVLRHMSHALARSKAQANTQGERP